MDLSATLNDAMKGLKIKVLGQGYNPTITSSASPFTNVPAGTQFIMLSITSAAVAFSFPVDGSTPAAVADQGLTLPVGMRTLLWDEALLNKMKAISASGKFQVVYCAYNV